MTLQVSVHSLQGSISNPEDGVTVILAIVNTALGTSAAGIFTLIFNKTGIVPGTDTHYSLLTTINGSLTGKIGIVKTARVLTAITESGCLILCCRYYCPLRWLRPLRTMGFNRSWRSKWTSLSLFKVTKN